MNKCPNCSQKVDEDVQFCPKCGQLIKSVKNVKDYVGIKKQASTINENEKNNGGKFKKLFIKLKDKLPNKIDKNKILKVRKEIGNNFKKLLHPIKNAKPTLEYFANHKYIFIITIIVIIFVGAQLISFLLDKHPKTTSIEFSKISQPFPQNGVIEKYYTEPEQVKLKIETESDKNLHYLIKIVNINQNSVVATAFIYPGQSLYIGLPTGIYEVKYAAGTTWYGMNQLFGQDTYYGKTVEKIDLSIPDSYPYFIELCNQYGANLRTDTINLDKF